MPVYNPNPTPPDGETSINIYGYDPSLGVGIAGVVLFSVFLLAHLLGALLAARRRSPIPSPLTRTRKQVVLFHCLLAFGCLMEIIGYAFRLKSHYNAFLLIPFVLQCA